MFRKLLTALCIYSCIWAFDATIPVLNLEDYHNPETNEEFLYQLEEAASTSGFFALTGVKLNPKLLDDAYEQFKQFFHAPLEIKRFYDGSSVGGQRGYVKGESAKGDSRMDFKEFFHIGPDLTEEEAQVRKVYPNIWPKEDFPKFKPCVSRLYKALQICARPLEKAFSILLGENEGFLSSMTKHSDTLMRALHYPAAPPKNSIWAAEHTDINLFTILPRATAKGLQVKNKEGKWIDVIVPEGAFIINVGDMLENLSNGFFKSAKHRVVDPGQKEERFSVVYFFHGNIDANMSPLSYMIKKTGGERLYPIATVKELLYERLIDLGLATPQMMEEFVEGSAIQRFEEVDRFSSKAEAALKEKGYL